MAGFTASYPKTSEVLVEHKPFAKTLILNRPEQLNALSYDMVSKLLELFLAYEEDPNVKLIVLKGNGRAFCTGGDISAIVRSFISEGFDRFAANFFRKNFTLNYVIATCKKSQVSMINGIVMGAGAGVSLHGRFRVVTEKTVFAMPETGLGFFPDVGASYFLSRLPGFFGEYVALTGARLDGAEMLACGLATHFVHSKKLPLLEEELSKGNFSDVQSISEILDKFSEHPVVKQKSAYHQLHIIEKCFSCRTVEEIISSLENEASINGSNWISAAIQSLKRASPTSLKVTLRSIREGRLQGIGQCLVRDYRIVQAQAKFSSDFIEGFRAILIDKDRNPKWNPSRLDLVSDSTVDRYFSRLNDDQGGDLTFPTRSNLPTSAMAKL